MIYDSTQDTLEHIGKVRVYLWRSVSHIEERALVHDQSKLHPPEKPIFDAITPKLKDLVYGSDEYKDAIAEMGEALTHHYANNSHHPEHFGDGIAGMCLFDVVEMLCDWKAASERHGTSDFAKSLEINRVRFGISDQLFSIFVNTAKAMGWV